MASHSKPNCDLFCHLRIYFVDCCWHLVCLLRLYYFCSTHYNTVHVKTYLVVVWVLLFHSRQIADTPFSYIVSRLLIYWSRKWKWRTEKIICSSQSLLLTVRAEAGYTSLLSRRASVILYRPWPCPQFTTDSSLDPCRPETPHKSCSFGDALNQCSTVLQSHTRS